MACSTQADVARGWEYQLERLETRLAAKPAQAVEVRGAIIAAPFPTFAPYRTDLPDRLASEAQSPDARHRERPSVDRDDSLLTHYARGRFGHGIWVSGNGIHRLPAPGSMALPRCGQQSG